MFKRFLIALFSSLSLVAQTPVWNLASTSVLRGNHTTSAIQKVDGSVLRLSISPDINAGEMEIFQERLSPCDVGFDVVGSYWGQNNEVSPNSDALNLSDGRAVFLMAYNWPSILNLNPGTNGFWSTFQGYAPTADSNFAQSVVQLVSGPNKGKLLYSARNNTLYILDPVTYSVSMVGAAYASMSMHNLSDGRVLMLTAEYPYCPDPTIPSRNTYQIYDPNTGMVTEYSDPVAQSNIRWGYSRFIDMNGMTYIITGTSLSLTSGTGYISIQKFDPSAVGTNHAFQVIQKALPSVNRVITSVAKTSDGNFLIAIAGTNSHGELWYFNSKTSVFTSLALPAGAGILALPSNIFPNGRNFLVLFDAVYLSTTVYSRPINVMSQMWHLTIQ